MKRTDRATQAELLQELTTFFRRVNESVDISLDEMAEIISPLQQTSEMIIQFVNSPDTGLHHVVTELEHAIAILGPGRTLELLHKKMRQDAAHRDLGSPRFQSNPNTQQKAG